MISLCECTILLCIKQKFHIFDFFCSQGFPIKIKMFRPSIYIYGCKWCIFNILMNKMKLLSFKKKIISFMYKQRKSNIYKLKTNRKILRKQNLDVPAKIKHILMCLYRESESLSHFSSQTLLLVVRNLNDRSEKNAYVSKPKLYCCLNIEMGLFR